MLLLRFQLIGQGTHLPLQSFGNGLFLFHVPFINSGVSFEDDLIPIGDIRLLLSSLREGDYLAAVFSPLVLRIFDFIDSYLIFLLEMI
jgi:hypothetical protein